MFVNNVLIVFQMGTNDHWVNPLPFFKQNYVNYFGKMLSKNSCCNNI